MKELLDKFGACREAREWVGDMSLQEAWDSCERGDWMLWLYSHMYPENIRELTLAKGHCANTVRELITDTRSLAAIDAAIAFGNSEITIDELKTASDDAHYAAADASASAAYTASHAASAAYTASYAASDAYTTAAASASAAYTAAYTAASFAASFAAAAKDSKYANQKITADICRKYLTICYG